MKKNSDFDAVKDSFERAKEQFRKQEAKKGGGDGKKAGGIVLAVLLALFVLVTGLGAFYNVSEQENAVVTMFGKVIRTDTAGLHFKIPYLQRVHMVDMTTHGIGIGYEVTDGGQNIANEEDGVMITSDFNFVDIDFYLEYKVSDPVAYIYNSARPEEIMRNLALASIRNTVSDYPVDDVMTTGKAQIQAEVKERLMAEMETHSVGLSIVNIQVQDAEPPTAEIVSAFKAVETAKQGKETAINNANKYRNEQIPAAEAEADRITQEAEAERASRIAEAEGQVERFGEMYRQYARYPLITKQRLFYETMEDVLPELKLIITDGNTQTMLPLESFAGGAAAED
ncbi:FtsH protease activity modulator HflK [Lachnoclostridium sp. Marseille-P6806]|uniref:FtsH protease activity modulator HflK n=1 Tax=Lachnoclostridium sp. Marseille-P6806 TaxID=2364793 RepID=UPI001031E1C3|nr:FtsH protease activity modulator HflK [Lachnoclostridium sp. Marseille-P6806]